MLRVGPPATGLLPPPQAVPDLPDVLVSCSGALLGSVLLPPGRMPDGRGAHYGGRASVIRLAGHRQGWVVALALDGVLDGQTGRRLHHVALLTAESLAQVRELFLRMGGAQAWRDLLPRIGPFVAAER